MGAGLIVKPALSQRFSVITFGLAQMAMDIEPGIRMWTNSDVLHGPTHTILGALFMAVLVALIAPGISNYLLTKWNQEVIHYKQPWLVQSAPVTRIAVTIGAFVGTLSHVVLDSLMHHDIHPLSPFSQANPVMGLITHDGVYQACTIAGLLGISAWLAIQYAAHIQQAKGERQHGA